MPAARSVRPSRSGTSSAANAPSSWITPIGGPAFGAPDAIAACLSATAMRRSRRRLHSRGDRGRSRTLPAHRGGDRRGQGRRLVSGPHGVGSARARQPLDRLRSAPRRHEGHSQRQDQTARIVSSVRAVGPRGGRVANGSKRTMPSPS